VLPKSVEKVITAPADPRVALHAQMGRTRISLVRSNAISAQLAMLAKIKALPLSFAPQEVMLLSAPWNAQVVMRAISALQLAGLSVFVLTAHTPFRIGLIVSSAPLATAASAFLPYLKNAQWELIRSEDNHFARPVRQVLMPLPLEL
jgi:hypothetical protein